MTKIMNLSPIKTSLTSAAGKTVIYHLPKVTDLGLPSPQPLPFSIKVLLENVLRHYERGLMPPNILEKVTNPAVRDKQPVELFFFPARVILQDFTGVPCLVDLAAMRDALNHLGGDPARINPRIPCHLVIDHSVQVDAHASPDALKTNVQKEFERNRERYAFLKWGQDTFENFTVVPPARGIIHQINLEYLARGVITAKENGKDIAFPDTLVGTDSHTTMINSLGIAGWGVGGIEAEAVMLGEPISLLLPQVVGVRLSGRLPDHATATDLVLTMTDILRQSGVVGKFVEFFGDGLSSLTLPDRAVLSNMTPEYGATMGFFPVDRETLNYYRLSGREPQILDLIERYFKEQGMFYSPGENEPEYQQIIDVDLTTIGPCLAGPKRPQDRIPLAQMKKQFETTFNRPPDNRTQPRLSDGAVAIAAITSCTNTSNPALMISAGLLAKNAVQRGLSVPNYVKTSFSPGSPVVEDYLRRSGLLPFLEQLGFHIVGFGCMTCIGNSGPLSAQMNSALKDKNLIATSVLSGNRNFEGRIHPLVKANYLASPALVIAYALAGTVAVDLEHQSVGKDKQGKEVFLKDIWPSAQQIQELMERYITTKAFTNSYCEILAGDENWHAIRAPQTELYLWDEQSTYIQQPPFFNGMTLEPPDISPITGVRVLVKAGDSVTTDHISPAGPIDPQSPAGKYLQESGVAINDFNSYGSRRGNDRVMTRGTFANVRMRNQLTPGKEGAWTVYFPDKKIMDIYAASQRYRKKNTPLLIVAGQQYGSGSSRDWAAKGTALLGVKIVLAESFERIHRSNLIGMGVLPLQFISGESAGSLGLTGEENFDFPDLGAEVQPGQTLQVHSRNADGQTRKFQVVCRLDTPLEVAYYRHGGILPYVIRKLLSNHSEGKKT